MKSAGQEAGLVAAVRDRAPGHGHGPLTAEGASLNADEQSVA
ncbi:hypothetical protein [Streptomyces syringium]